MEIFNSVAAVISNDVLSKIPEKELNDLKIYAKSKGATLVSESGKHIVTGNHDAVEDIKRFIKTLVEDQSENPGAGENSEDEDTQQSYSPTRKRKVQNSAGARKKQKSTEDDDPDYEPGSMPTKTVKGKKRRLVVQKNPEKTISVQNVGAKGKQKSQISISRRPPQPTQIIRLPTFDEMIDSGSTTVQTELSVAKTTRRKQKRHLFDMKTELIRFGRTNAEIEHDKALEASNNSENEQNVLHVNIICKNETNDSEATSSQLESNEDAAENLESGNKTDSDETDDAGLKFTALTGSEEEETLEEEEEEDEEEEEEEDVDYKETKKKRRRRKTGKKKQQHPIYRIVDKPLVKLNGLPKKSILYVKTTDEYQCGECGYIGASTQVIKGHQYMHHQTDGHLCDVCDICFKVVKLDCLLGKHREGHFDSKGKLWPSSIVVHKIRLKQFGLKENLVGDLLEQIQEYDKQNPDVHETPKLLDAPEEKTRKPMQCTICFATLSSERFLRVHMRKVHAENKKRVISEHYTKQLGKLRGKAVDQTSYSCPKCDFTTTRLQNFNSHFRQHDNPDFFYCDVEGCDYKNKHNSEIRRHKRNSHSDKTYECEHCPMKFRTQPNLNAHVKSKHTREYSKVCEICGKRLSSVSAYRRHMDSHHGNIDVMPGEKIMCQKCGRVFNTFGAYESHQKRYHNDDEEAALKEEKLVSEGLNVLHNGQLFECKHCQKFSNTSARAVRQHIVRMHLDKPFRCHHCEQQFPRRNFLVKHIAVHHLGMEVASCPECGKEFKNKTYLSHHRRRMHLQSTSDFQCKVCRKFFARKHDYEKHLDIHKPVEERKWEFPCTQCDRRFRFKSNLDYHMLEHTGVKAFECKLCSKKFKTAAILNKHLLSHTEHRAFHCPHCDKCFKQQKSLDVHLMSHTTGFIICHACCMHFPHTDALKRHVCRAITSPGSDGDVVTVEPIDSTSHVDEEFVITEEIPSCDLDTDMLEIQQQHAPSTQQQDQQNEVTIVDNEYSLVEPGEITEMLEEDETGGSYFVLKSGIDIDPAVFQTLAQLEQPAEIRLGDQSYMAVPSYEHLSGEQAVPSNEPIVLLNDFNGSDSAQNLTVVHEISETSDSINNFEVQTVGEDVLETNKETQIVFVQNDVTLKQPENSASGQAEIENCPNKGVVFSISNNMIGNLQTVERNIPVSSCTVENPDVVQNIVDMDSENVVFIPNSVE